VVTLPVIKIQHTLPQDKGLVVVIMNNEVTVKVDQPVKIAVADKIRVYEKQTGLRVKDIRVTVGGVDRDVVKINAAFKPGTSYQVVFYEGALESEVKPHIVNSTLGWDLSTSGKKEGMMNETR
jgi:hypothetical protein